MTVLSTFLESSLNFLFNNTKKILQNLVQSGKKAVSKFDLSSIRRRETKSANRVILYSLPSLVTSNLN